MDLHYTLTALPRDDPGVRLTKINRVLPNLDDINKMCRGEIALGDLRPYVDWAEGKLHEKFFEFDFVVVLKRRHEHLGFAFIHNNSDKTSLNVDMICANQKGKTVMEGVFVLADLLNRGQSFDIEKVTLQAVPNVFGFYREVGFKTVSANSEPSPLDELWDKLSAGADTTEKEKPLSFTEDHLQAQIAKFKYLDGMKSYNQSSRHKILRSLFIHKGNKQTIKATMSELLESYDDLLQMYDAIEQALQTIPRKEFDHSVPMEIDLTSTLIESLPDLQKSLYLKPYYDADNFLEAYIDPMGNSSDEEIQEIQQVDGETTETDEEMQEQGEEINHVEDSCAPTPTRYRTFAGPDQSCPAEARVLEDGDKCCTSRPNGSEGYPNPPSHPDSLRFLLALRTVYVSSDSPLNIPVELQRTLTWINEYQPSNMINPSNQSILFIPVQSTWLVTILKFAFMSSCKMPIGVGLTTGYRELYRKCLDGGACVNLYTDLDADATLNAVNEVGVKRVNVIMSEFENKPTHFRLPFMNALEVNVVGAKSIPVKLEELTNFILKGSGRSETSSLTLNRPLISGDSSPPHELFSEMIKNLPQTCGTRVINFANSICRPSALKGHYLVNIPHSFLKLLGESLGNEDPPTFRIPEKSHRSMLSTTYKGFTIFFKYDSSDVYLTITQKRTRQDKHKRKGVDQYNLDGTLHATYDGLRIAAEAVRGEKSAGAVRQQLSKSILYGDVFKGSKWAFAGDDIQEEKVPKRPRRMKAPRKALPKVLQFSKDGQFIRTFTNIEEASATLGGIRGTAYTSLRRRIDDGREIGGFRWAFEGEQLVTPSQGPLQDNFKSKAVSQYTLHGEFLTTYPSMRQVFTSLGKTSNLSNTLGKKIERGEAWNGYRWAFEGTPLIMN